MKKRTFIAAAVAALASACGLAPAAPKVVKRDTFWSAMVISAGTSNEKWDACIREMRRVGAPEGHVLSFRSLEGGDTLILSHAPGRDVAELQRKHAAINA